MKKITLLFACIALSFSVYSQQTISFETSEGFAAGDINTQNGWFTTGCGTGCFVQNQIVTNEAATAGTNSLKIINESAFGGQANPIIGGFYNYPTAIPYATSVFSADINISEQNGNSSDYIFGLVNSTAGSFVTYIRFTYLGDIEVLVNNGTATALEDTLANWTAATWINVKIEITGTAVKFFIDSTEIYSSLLATNADIEQARFVHDNFDGFAYFDNFKTNNETLSVETFNTDSIKAFYNKGVNALVLESSNNAFTNIQVFDILGKQVLAKGLSNTEESVSLDTMQTGVYIAKVSTANGTKTVKFVKN